MAMTSSPQRKKQTLKILYLAHGHLRSLYRRSSAAPRSASIAHDQAVTMSYRTVNRTATTSDSDYVATTGTLTFAPGETTKTIAIAVKGDSKKVANETFYLDLFGNSSNSLFTKNRGLGTILTDD
jgi:hypothetical protein